jgi:hypothetical protein
MIKKHKNKDELLTQEEADEVHERVKIAAHLQSLEGNPLDAHDWAMFEMFYRERGSHEKRREYILEQASQFKLQS